MVATKKKKTKKIETPYNPRQLLWIVEPKEETWSSAHCWVWLSQCGHYRVYRIEPVDGTVRYGTCRRVANGWWSLEVNSRLGPGYPRYYGDLASALLVAERHCCRDGNDSLGTDPPVNNRDELLAWAKEKNLLQGSVVPAPHYYQAPGGSILEKERPSIKAKRQSHGERNHQGVREGTNEAKALAVLTAEPKTMKQLMAEAQLTGTVYSFMNKLIKAGRVRKTPEGYSLVDEKKD